MAEPTIEWDILGDKDRIELVIKHIMGWEITDRLYPNDPSLTSIAFYDTDDQEWYELDLTRRWETKFHPFDSIVDAWRVMKKITHPSSREEAIDGANIRFVNWWRETAIWSISDSIIGHVFCIEALRAKNFNVRTQKYEDIYV